MTGSDVSGLHDATERVCVVGDLAFDYYLGLPDTTSTDEGADEKTTAVWSIRATGGTGANAAAALAALGVPVALYSVVGDDPIGASLISDMRRRGVSSSGVRIAPGATMQATILLQGAQRRVIIDRGVYDQLGEAPLALPKSRLTYVTGSPGAVLNALHAKAATTRPSDSHAELIVAGLEAWMFTFPGLIERLSLLDLVVTNSAGWIPLAAHAAGAVDVVETRSVEGAVIHFRSGETVAIPAFPIRVVDATGAGDCFAGAVCRYLWSGAGLIEAVKLGCVAAALSTQAIGAQAALPDDAQVRGAAATFTTKESV